VGFKRICTIPLPTALSFLSSDSVGAGFAAPGFFAYLVGVVVPLIGISLLVGLWVRLACVLGILISVEPNAGCLVGTGSGAAVGRCFGGRLDALPLRLQN